LPSTQNHHIISLKQSHPLYCAICRELAEALLAFTGPFQLFKEALLHFVSILYSPASNLIASTRQHLTQSRAFGSTQQYNTTSPLFRSQPSAAVQKPSLDRLHFQLVHFTWTKRYSSHFLYRYYCSSSRHSLHIRRGISDRTLGYRTREERGSFGRRSQGGGSYRYWTSPRA
jgi:hypothetical protein